VIAWLTKRSLRVKAIVFVLVVMTMALLVTGTVSIVQTNLLIASQQRGSVNSLAQSLARVCELPLAVRNRAELSRLLNRLTQDKYVLFTAVYDDKHQLMASNIRNEAAWQSYQQHAGETASMLLSTVQVELSQGTDEFDVFGIGEYPASRPSRSSENVGTSASRQNVLGHVVVALSTEPMYLAQRSQTWVTLSMLILAAAGSSAIVFWTVTRWTKRLNNLVEASGRIARGDFTVAVFDSHVDEIGRLSKAYEEMRKAVQQRTTQLVQANEQIRQAQTDLVQAEKMSMLGQLVAGVAHEINTPTGAIMNIANDAGTHLQDLAAAAANLHQLPEDLRRWLADAVPRILSHTATFSETMDRQARQQLELNLQHQGVANPRRVAEVLIDCGLTASDADAVRCLSHEAGLRYLEHLIALGVGAEISLISVRKIAKIIQALRYYSRSGEGDLFDINVNESLDNTLVILQNRIKRLAKVERQYEENIPSVRCGPDISQIWTNVLSNSCDAIEGVGQGEGQIRITTSTRDQQAVVEIFNSGPPIPQEVISRIFDPFFTTKPIGKGTGLGLSICTGILRKYHGTITVRNDPGGVTFEVTLPCGKGTHVEHERSSGSAEGVTCQTS
jgi:C4-dicarboxylate-specific signal transduction histidine kinase